MELQVLKVYPDYLVIEVLKVIKDHLEHSVFQDKRENLDDQVLNIILYRLRYNDKE
jgi:hypothetical protein